MCVTNTTGRRPLPVSLNPALVSFCPSAPQRPTACCVASVAQKLPGSVPVASPFVPAAVYYQQQFPVLSSPSVHDEKTRPKRRRKPQKPGKTAKNNDRHFVVHEYHDHSMDQECSDQQDDSGDESYRKRGGVVSSFPVKLHEVLDQVVEDGLDHIVSWAMHGRCFAIHRPKEFVDYVMPK
jgi:hypothetical protein